MKKTVSLKPQDVALLAKLITYKGDQWRQVDLAQELGLSQGEIAKSISRLSKAGLINEKRVNRLAALEFILHAVKYAFPAEVGALTVGIPTGISAPAHEKMVVQSSNDIYVWPSTQGSHRGQLIKPFYANLAEAALRDSDFYAFMAAIEILRIGRARERKLAQIYIEGKIKNL
ncbi:MAG: hypothetical protein ACOYOK_12785 [Pseudobdellovibrionaceae bacterium]